MEYICQNWAFLVTKACAVAAMPRCTWGKWQFIEGSRRHLTPRTLEQTGQPCWSNFESKYLEWEKILSWTMLTNRPWKDFFHLGAMKPTPSQNYQNDLTSTLGACSTLGILGWPNPQGADVIRLLGATLPFYLTPKYRKKKKWNNDLFFFYTSTLPSLISSPYLLLNYVKIIKNEINIF